MNTKIFQAIASIVIFSAAATAVEKPLSTYSAEECYDLIQRGGEPFIKAHGDELLNFLYFRKKPTDAELLEMTSNPQIVKEKKRDLPVFQALRKGGNTTLQLLRESNYFDYPQHPTDLEVIAYLLHEMIGQDGAVKYIGDRVNEGTAYTRENWLTISDMLNRPELASGRFIVEKTVKGSTAEPKPTIEQLRQQRMQLKSFLTPMSHESRQNFLSIHFQFRRVVQACILYHTTHKQWPSSVFSLTHEGNLQESETQFLDSDQFWYVPRISKNIRPDNTEQCILKLVTPDGKFTLQGYQNGVISVLQVDGK